MTSENKVYNVAVFPMKNESENRIIARVVYRVLISNLINSSRFNVVEEGEVRNFLFKGGVLPGDFPDYSKLQKLREESGADIIVGGSVLKADDKSGTVRMALILWARNIADGKLLWTTYYVKSGEDYRKFFHFGKIFSLNELATKMLSDIVIEWEKNLK